MTNEIKIGNRIRELRQKKGLTQKELAGEHITRNMLSLIESGTASPSLTTLCYLSEKLEVPIGYFFTHTPEEERTGKEEKPLISRRFTGLDGKELSEQVCLSHKTTLEHWLKKRETDKNAVISTIATIPQIRMTRKIVGEYELAHTEMHTFFEDSIGMVSNWKKRGPVYEVPFRTLYNKEMKNLIVAGRCTSVNETLWDVMRVIPCCAVTGQAAGTAAAMTDDFSSLDVSKLQEKLRHNGVVIHENDILE